MTKFLTAAQMRAIEQAAIASGQVTGLELMERAGAGVVAAVLEEWPVMALSPQRAVVLCGPGNNGGDGFVVARLLRARGWAVEVFLCGDPDRLPPDARVNHMRWCEVGAVSQMSAPRRAGYDPWGCALLVDAVFGTGLTRPVSFEVGMGQHLPEWDLRFEPQRPRVVAVDGPSGLCLDSGRRLQNGDCLWADLTVTFHAPKVGHFLAEGPFLCGKVVLADLGIAQTSSADGVSRQSPDGPIRLYPPEVLRQQDGPAALVTASKGWLGKDDFDGQPAHKYTHGHALILSGPATRTGAARLAARGALRIGAGLVTVGAPDNALPECAAHLTAIMLRHVGQGAELADLLQDKRINALCLGPGLGVDARAAGLVAAALEVGGDAAPQNPVPGLTRDLSPGVASGEGGGPGSSPGRGSGARNVVLDADALTLLARDATLFAALHPACILTPHAGEFARLFPDIAARLAAPVTTGPAYSKVDATREAAARAGCVVLFKGPDTIIADPSGRSAINAAAYDRAAPWLATAGSGDVLAGFITGLLARGFAPFDAACTAAWAHVECALQFGPGLIAEDLPEQLPAIMRRLV